VQAVGAAHHRYELAPPIELASVDLPDDLRAFVRDIGAGGAGPYYGWLPIERAAKRLIEAPVAVTAWQRALPIAHLGCGYAALVRSTVRRAARCGSTRAPRPRRPIRRRSPRSTSNGSTASLATRGPRLRAPGACALASALSATSDVRAAPRVPAGSLAGEQLRDALAELDRGDRDRRRRSARAVRPGDRSTRACLRAPPRQPRAEVSAATWWRPVSDPSSRVRR